MPRHTATRNRTSGNRRPFRPAQRRAATSPAFLAIGGLLALGIVLAAGGFTFAASQEQHDPFCASCHSQPETTFYQRSAAGQPGDLASYHTTKDTLCINCHSGAGSTGRIAAELMGARNAMLWYTGRATQPAPLTVPIRDGNCLKCHPQVTASRSRANHFHYFLARWQAGDANAAGCVTCHSGHMTDGNAETGFQNEAKTEAVCQACHDALGQGD